MPKYKRRTRKEKITNILTGTALVLMAAGLLTDLQICGVNASQILLLFSLAAVTTSLTVSNHIKTIKMRKKQRKCTQPVEARVLAYDSERTVEYAGDGIYLFAKLWSPLLTYRTGGITRSVHSGKYNVFFQKAHAKAVSNKRKRDRLYLPR